MYYEKSIIFFNIKIFKILFETKLKECKHRLHHTKSLLLNLKLTTNKVTRNSFESSSTSVISISFFTCIMYSIVPRIIN